MPVDDEPGIMHVHSMPKGARAAEIMRESMAHFTQWNSVFGLLLANSDLFFDQEWE